MNWNINFISEEDFKTHVRSTIDYYGDKLRPFDLARLNENIIDPVKLIFDKSVYGASWSEIIKSEIFRQRDKAYSELKRSAEKFFNLSADNAMIMALYILGFGTYNGFNKLASHK